MADTKEAVNAKNSLKMLKSRQSSKISTTTTNKPVPPSTQKFTKSSSPSSTITSPLSPINTAKTSSSPKTSVKPSQIPVPTKFHVSPLINNNIKNNNTPTLSKQDNVKQAHTVLPTLSSPIQQPTNNIGLSQVNSPSTANSSSLPELRASQASSTPTSNVPHILSPTPPTTIKPQKSPSTNKTAFTITHQNADVTPSSISSRVSPSSSSSSKPLLFSHHPAVDLTQLTHDIRVAMSQVKEKVHI